LFSVKDPFVCRDPVIQARSGTSLQFANFRQPDPPAIANKTPTSSLSI